MFDTLTFFLWLCFGLRCYTAKYIQVQHCRWRSCLFSCAFCSACWSSQTRRRLAGAIVKHGEKHGMGNGWVYWEVLVDTVKMAHFAGCHQLSKWGVCSCLSIVWVGCVMNPVHVWRYDLGFSERQPGAVRAGGYSTRCESMAWGGGSCAWQRQGINLVYQKYIIRVGELYAAYLPCTATLQILNYCTAQPFWPELHDLEENWYEVLHWTLIQGKAGKHCKHIYTEPMYSFERCMDSGVCVLYRYDICFERSEHDCIASVFSMATSSFRTHRLELLVRTLLVANRIGRIGSMEWIRTSLPLLCRALSSQTSPQNHLDKLSGENQSCQRLGHPEIETPFGRWWDFKKQWIRQIHSMDIA